MTLEILPEGLILTVSGVLPEGVKMTLEILPEGLILTGEILLPGVAKGRAGRADVRIGLNCIIKMSDPRKALRGFALKSGTITT